MNQEWWGVKEDVSTETSTDDDNEEGCDMIEDSSAELQDKQDVYEQNEEDVGQEMNVEAFKCVMTKMDEMGRVLLAVAREKGDTGNPENWARAVRIMLKSALWM
jgi:hypothetical protein